MAALLFQNSLGSFQKSSASDRQALGKSQFSFEFRTKHRNRNRDLFMYRYTNFLIFQKPSEAGPTAAPPCGLVHKVAQTTCISMTNCDITPSSETKDLCDNQAKYVSRVRCLTSQKLDHVRQTRTEIFKIHESSSKPTPPPAESSSSLAQNSEQAP